MAKTQKPLAELSQEELLALATSQQAEIQGYKTTIKEQSDSIAAYEATIADLHTQISKLDNKVSNKPTEGKVGGKTYVIATPKFKHNGTVIESADLFDKHPEVAKELVANKSDLLTLKD